MGAEEQNKQLDFKDIQNGPMSQANRECRDVFCCLLFFANIIAMIYCSIYGWVNGDPTKIWRATDENSPAQWCGYPGGNTADYPYAYFFNPLDSLNHRACVKSCPAYQSGSITQPICYDAGGTVNCGTATWATISEDGKTYSAGSYAASTYLLYNSYSVLGRICIPNSSVFTQLFSTIASSFASASSSGYLGDFISDIKNNWMYILAAFGLAIILAFVFMYALKCLAGCIVWVSIFGIILMFAGAGVIFFYNAGMLSSAESYTGYLGIPTLSGGDTQNYKIYGYISFGITGLLLIILLCCCSRIRLAVAVCKAAGQFVSGVCLIVLVPIFQTMLVGILWACAIIVMIYLASAATFTYVSGDIFTSIASYQDQNLIRLYYFIFGTLWSNAILQAMCIFVIASACCMWYYSHGPGQQLDSPILRSYKMVFRYHFGSLAFGSFILALVQFMQIIVQLFKKQAESTGADKNPCFEYVINCLRCCLACVQRIVQFINKTAYIQIALRGKNFCMAAKDGFETVWSNGLRYAVVAGIGQVIMFIGKLMISASTTALFYCLITFVESIKSQVLQPILLLILVFIIAYAVSTFFMSVYSVAMDTLLACFIADEANQKAKGGKAPMYAPEDLAELIDRD